MKLISIKAGNGKVHRFLLGENGKPVDNALCSIRQPYNAKKPWVEVKDTKTTCDRCDYSEKEMRAAALMESRKADVCGYIRELLQVEDLALDEIKDKLAVLWGKDVGGVGVPATILYDLLADMRKQGIVEVGAGAKPKYSLVTSLDAIPGLPKRIPRTPDNLPPGTTRRSPSLLQGGGPAPAKTTEAKTAPKTTKERYRNWQIGPAAVHRVDTWDGVPVPSGSGSALCAAICGYRPPYNHRTGWREPDPGRGLTCDKCLELEVIRLGAPKSGRPTSPLPPAEHAAVEAVFGEGFVEKTLGIEPAEELADDARMEKELGLGDGFFSGLESVLTARAAEQKAALLQPEDKLLDPGDLEAFAHIEEPLAAAVWSLALCWEPRGLAATLVMSDSDKIPRPGQGMKDAVIVYLGLHSCEQAAIEAAAAWLSDPAEVRAVLGIPEPVPVAA